MSVIAPPPTKRRWLLPVIVLVAVGAGAGAYAYWRLQRALVPEVALPGVEARVIEEVEKARAEVVVDPASGEAWGKVGLVLFANSLYPEAGAWLERAEQMAPADARWPYYRGMIVLLEKPEEGMLFLKRAAELAPRDADIQLRLAETLLTLDRVDEADAAFAEVLRLRANNPRALLGRGLLLLRRDQPAAAIPLLRPATQHATARKAGHAALAEALARTGDDTGADEQRKLADAAPKDPAWPDPKLLQIVNLQVNLNGRLRRAKGLIAGGQIDEGLALAQQAVRDRPDSAEAHLTLGMAMLRANQTDDAQAEFQQAIDREPKLAEAQMWMGAVLLEVRHDPAAAEPYYRKVLELRAGDALAYYKIALCRLQQNDKAGAVEQLTQSVRYRPGFAAAHLMLGELHLEAGRTAAAVASLETAAKLEPANEKARELLAKARKP